MGLQKSQFLNSLWNWKKLWKCNIGLYLKNSIFQLGKLEKSSWSNIQNPKISLLIGKDLKVQSKTNTQKTLNLWMKWENLCPNLSFTAENNLHKIRLFTFETKYVMNEIYHYM